MGEHSDNRSGHAVVQCGHGNRADNRRRGMASVEKFKHVTDLFRCPEHRVGHWGGRVRVSKRHLLAVV